MGYIFAALILLVFLAAVVGFARPRSGKAQTHDGPAAGQPFTRTEPAADEPTPDASDTNRPSRIASAQERVPPA